MSTEAQAALINISQPQVPEQVERDGFESQLELAISSGTVGPKSALGQNCTRDWGPDEKEALEHDGACCWIGRIPKPEVQSIQVIASCLTFMSCGSRANNLLQHMARPTVGAKAGQRKLLSRWSGPRVLTRICRRANSTASRIMKPRCRVAQICLQSKCGVKRAWTKTASM